MRLTLPLVSLVLVSAPACFEDPGSGGTGGETAGDEFGGPRSGPWLVAQEALTSDSCMHTTPPDTITGMVDLINHEDGTFTIVLNDDAQTTLSCQLQGTTYTCDPLVVDATVPLLDAAIHTVTNSSGEFSSDEQGTGHYVVDLSCSGTACDIAASGSGVSGYPCSYEAPFSFIYSP